MAGVATWVVFFIDNTAAQGALISGSSAVGVMSFIVGLVWELLAAQDISPWFEYVSSACNVADPLSRGSTDLAVSLGGVFTKC